MDGPGCQKSGDELMESLAAQEIHGCKYLLSSAWQSDEWADQAFDYAGDPRLRTWVTGAFLSFGAIAA